MKNYKYHQLYEEYNAKELAKFNNPELSRQSEDTENQPLEPDQIEVKLDETETALIQEQMRAFCETTLQDKDQMAKLWRIHSPGKWDTLHKNSLKTVFRASLITQDGSPEEYTLDLKKDFVYKPKKNSPGITKIKNQLIEDVIRSFYNHENKLEQEKHKEIIECASKFAGGDAVLEEILQVHLQMNSGEKAYPHKIKTGAVETDVKDLPALMEFYQVGRNASHSFYLGVHEGKIYSYACGEGDFYFIDDNGTEYSEDQVGWKESDDIFDAVTQDGRRLYQQTRLDRHISGPYASLKGAGYIGHF